MSFSLQYVIQKQTPRCQVMQQDTDKTSEATKRLNLFLLKSGEGFEAPKGFVFFMLAATSKCVRKV